MPFDQLFNQQVMGKIVSFVERQLDEEGVVTQVCSPAYSAPLR